MSVQQPVLPQISVVVCTYNRKKFIGKALQTLAAQTLPADEYEVLIIDNRSTDGTAEICNAFIAAHTNLPFRYIYEANKGLSFARNRGWQEARSPIIAYIDDDAEATPDFLQHIVTFFQGHPDAIGAGGRIIPVYPETGEPGWMNKYLNGFVGRMDFGEAIKLFEGKMKYPAGCNMIYKKEALQQAGGFNNELTFRSDDKYIYFQISKISNKVYYLPQAKVYHNIDADRLQFASFKKLFLKTGNEEKVRLRTEGGNLWRKGLELLVKFGASWAIYLRFLVAGESLKGKYVVLAQWFTLKGFLQKQVFVR